ncbi:hypothetical protein PCURB6_01800 [Paenibacillus curdlanolyticus]|nr:hypothetical protein PCURB6_01800 [Paenibacillus curdlanolyticus]
MEGLGAWGQSRARGWRRCVVLGLILTLLAFVAAGCTEERKEERAQVQLKVLDYNKQSFYSTYGDYIAAAFPNVNVEVVPTEGMFDVKLPFKERLQQLTTLITTEQPDLIFLSDNDMYHALADEGLLSELSAFLAADPELEQHIHPGVLEHMRNERSGELYGLAADFSVLLLYYNEDLFQQLGVEPPRDDMTWDELLKLAQRVTQASSDADGVIGLLPDFAGPSGLVSLMAMTEGLGLFPYRASTGIMLADTPSWRQMFTTALDAYRMDTFRTKGLAPGQEQPTALAGGNSNWFRAGCAGMVIAGYGSYDDVTFKLGAVTPPVDAATRQRSFGMGSSLTMSIRAGSPLAKESWNMIAFMMSDYVAKVRAKLGVQYTGTSFFPSNITYADYSNDRFVASVYRQLPSYEPDDKGAALSNEAYNAMNDLFRSEVDEALAGSQTFEEMIERLQTEGKKILEWGIRSKGDMSSYIMIDDLD